MDSMPKEKSKPSHTLINIDALVRHSLLISSPGGHVAHTGQASSQWSAAEMGVATIGSGQS